MKRELCMHRRTTLFFGLFTLLAALPGCSKKSDTAASKASVVLALDWVPEPEFGGFYAAREGGLFAKAGLDVVIVGGGAGVPVVQMVAAGQADFGISGADEILMARARGVDIVPLFAVFQTSPQAIMVHASRDVKNISDLLAQGGTLAIEHGLPYAAFLKKKYGFDKVRVVPYDGGIAQFVLDKSYAQQCFVTSEPIAARKQGAMPTTFLIADEGYNPYIVVAVTRRALLKEKPDLVRAFRRAALDGWRRYLDDPAPTNAVIAKLNPSLDPTALPMIAATQQPLIETTVTRAKGLGAMSKERWTAIMQQLVELKIIDQPLPVDDLLAAAE